MQICVCDKCGKTVVDGNFFIISIISTKTIGAKFIKLCEGCGMELEKILKENKEDRWFHE